MRIVLRAKDRRIACCELTSTAMMAIPYLMNPTHGHDLQCGLWPMRLLACRPPCALMVEDELVMASEIVLGALRG